MGQPDGTAGLKTASAPGVSGKTTLRVRYSEADHMGVVHHSHYLIWFEIGRTELMRKIGTPYADLEKAGVYMPVIEAACTYHSSAYYDELLEIESAVTEATRVKVAFTYRVIRPADDRLLASGRTVHVATDGTGAPRRMPAEIVAFLMPGKEHN